MGGSAKNARWGDSVGRVEKLPRRSVDARSSVVVASVVVASVGASVGAVVDGDA